MKRPVFGRIAANLEGLCLLTSRDNCFVADGNVSIRHQGEIRAVDPTGKTIQTKLVQVKNRVIECQPLLMGDTHRGSPTRKKHFDIDALVTRASARPRDGNEI